MKDLLQPVENLGTQTKNYLLQHSTGSGKSLTIACLVYCLYFLKVSDSPSIDQTEGLIDQLKDVWDVQKHRFYKIIAMNDRKILDEQLGETITRFLRHHQLLDIGRAKTSVQLLG